jgi:hypothetical protein
VIEKYFIQFIVWRRKNVDLIESSLLPLHLGHLKPQKTFSKICKDDRNPA